MSRRSLVSLGAIAAVIAIVWLAPGPVAGQARTAAGADKWTSPRTPWGDPDLQGQWNSQTSTPLQRPLEGPLAGKEEISDEEAKTLEDAMAAQGPLIGLGIDLREEQAWGHCMVFAIKDHLKA